MKVQSKHSTRVRVSPRVGIKTEYSTRPGVTYDVERTTSNSLGDWYYLTHDTAPIGWAKKDSNGVENFRDI